jgi:uncharacterized protein GlcG (DUF336 family)
MTITLAQARSILDAALTHARAQDAQPLAIVILDAGAHPVAFAREDGASLFRFDIARAKASGALGLGADTRVIATRAVANPAFFQSVVAVTGGQLALSPGGVIIRALPTEPHHEITQHRTGAAPRRRGRCLPDRHMGHGLR